MGHPLCAHQRSTIGRHGSSAIEIAEILQLGKRQGGCLPTWPKYLAPIFPDHVDAGLVSAETVDPTLVSGRVGLPSNGAIEQSRAAREDVLATRDGPSK
jgi:hypothetical protein